MSVPRRIDLHMHTSVSDGTDSPEEILRLVREAEIDVFSVTDHDAVKAGRIIRGILGEGDPLFIPGAEFSCRDEEGKYHILGYGFDPEDPAIVGVVSRGHGFRMKKVLARLDFIRREFGFTFPPEEIDDLMSEDNPGKPHIGNLMVKYGYAESKEEAIRKYINGIRFKNEYVRPEEAIRGILDAGGVPVLAHPFYGDGDDLILGGDMEDRVRRLKGLGLCGVEAFYSGFTAKLRRDMLDMAERYDLLVTAGSDYHGSNKLVTLGDTGLDEEDEYPDGLRRFLELFER
ncbi:MAG: PHP domain-containing protein [Clostridia bacterium]|nr:PHP domain-containing protein [Clostridia bacterium]